MSTNITMRVEYNPKLDNVRFDYLWRCGDLFKWDFEYQFEPVPIYDGQNYGLYSVLADVRNYEKLPSIRDNSFPTDACDYVKDDYLKSLDKVSPSYATLAELNKANRDIKLTEEDVEVYSAKYAAVNGLEQLITLLLERVPVLYVDEITECKKTLMEKYGDHIRVVYWFDC